MRLNYAKVAPAGMKAMLDLEKYVKASSLEPKLFELVKMRASQLNGCAYCLDMHSKDARNLGETEQRLYTLSAWRETDFYSDREKAALEWTEILTGIMNHHITDALYQKVAAHFSEEEMAALTFLIVTINGWNRLAISFGSEAGTYQPKRDTP